ncbi:hypothetical protein Tco_0920540 [Tanacetum coccineum]
MTPPLGFLTLNPIPGPNANELTPISVSTFTATTPENTPLTHHASTSANPDPMISPAFVEANYKEYDEETKVEPRPVCIRKTTLVLRTRSSRAQRQRERVVKFEDALNRDMSRVERSSEGGRPLEDRAGTDTPYLLDGYDVLVFRIVIFKISSFKLQNARLLLMVRPITP